MPEDTAEDGRTALPPDRFDRVTIAIHRLSLRRPAGAMVSGPGFTVRRQGHSLVRWTRGGLEYWAVSGVDAADLQAFRDAFTRAS